MRKRDSMTVVTYLLQGKRKTITLGGTPDFRRIITRVWLNAQTDTFSFIREHETGKKTYFTVTNGELTEVTPERFMNHSINLK